MASENSMIISLKKKIGIIPNTRIKKLWSSATNRDIDILVVTHGLACFYEIKVEGKQPTEWQHNRLDWWAGSLSEVGWYDNVNDCVARVQLIANRAAQHADLLANITRK